MFFFLSFHLFHMNLFQNIISLAKQTKNVLTHKLLKEKRIEHIFGKTRLV